MNQPPARERKPNAHGASDQANEIDRKVFRPLQVDAPGAPDPLADRKLARFSIAEILFLQLAAAGVIWLGWYVLPGPLVCLAFPFVVAVWAAFRLRNFPHLTWINPFTIAVAVNTLGMLVLSVVTLYYLPWQPWLGKNFRVEDAVVGVLIGGPAFGCLQALIAMLLVRGWQTLFERPSNSE